LSPGAGTSAPDGGEYSTDSFCYLSGGSVIVGGEEMPGSEQQRLAQLEAIEAIKQLKYRYCAYCDDKYNPSGIAALFTEDGIWEGESFGRHVGRAAITAHFQRVSGEIVFAAHLALNPIIEVDDDTATGKWRLIIPATVITSGIKEARWLWGAYDDHYVRVDGVWMFKRLSFPSIFIPLTPETGQNQPSSRTEIDRL
jgi:hypothetical protein